jgi:DNA-binding NarL/FixJ family response regulator
MHKRILIVDDNAPIRGIIRAAIESRPGFKVCGEAADGAEGIEKGRELKPDLIVLDLSMPRMNGLRTAAVLQTIVPHTRIILFTAYKNVISVPLAHDCGVTSVISKSDQLGTLIDEVQRLTA